MKVKEVVRKLSKDNSLILLKLADQFGELDEEVFKAAIRTKLIKNRGGWEEKINIVTLPLPGDVIFEEFYFLNDELVATMILNSSVDPEINCSNLTIILGSSFNSFLQLLIQGVDFDQGLSTNNLIKELDIYRKLYITLWDYIINKSPNQNSELIIQLAEEELEKAKEQLDRIL